MLLEPFIAEDRLVVLRNKLHFTGLLLSDNGKIFIMWHHGLSVTALGQTDQHVHLATAILFTAVYAQHTRAQRR